MSEQNSYPASSQFVMVPYAMMQAFATGEVSAPAYALYTVIRFHWGGFDRTFPKQETIAEKSGMSVPSVKRLLKELADKGWIIKERQSRVHGGNEYWICDVPFVRHANAPKAASARKRTSTCSKPVNKAAQGWNSEEEKRPRREFAIAKKQAQTTQASSTEGKLADSNFESILDDMNDW
ncbi:helix-turn-helix domain-containing protein [Micromonospora sp. CA-248260]|uniref:helix-turn-helix domain-containing protein n=1 Tax=Micromonospora sp. CA-248260 TaxID=3239962 RepID=UPI003D920D14